MLAYLAKVLFKGSWACADPQEVLSADKKFKTTVNKMWRKMEKFGWYEGNFNECNKISDAYQLFLKTGKIMSDSEI